MPDRNPSDPDTVDPVDPAVERRLTEAFGALATGEVPSSTPRPGHGPRPAVRAAASRRRRLGLAGGGLLVAAAAVVLALVLGGEVGDARRTSSAPPATQSATTVTSPPTTSAAPSTPPPTTTSPTGTPGSGTPGTGTSAGPPSAAEVAAAFAAATADTRSEVVAVPGGWEGADLESGTIRFWRSDDGRTWSEDGSSSYPADVRGDGRTTYTAVIRQAATLTGMQHASFLVYGDAFTGDSTGFVIVYTDGPDGWGAVKAGSDGDLHPSGAPVDRANQIGLMYDGSLDGGLLHTVDCAVPTGGPLADCGTNQVDKSWRWDGARFVLAN